MIEKAAGIILQNRKMLVERSYNKPFFISPGGQIEPGETATQALVRELKEEFTIDVAKQDLEPFATYTADAANHPGKTVRMQVFMVKKWRGTITPSSEVEQIMWLTSDLPKGVNVGNIFGHQVLPELKRRDLVD